MFSWRLVGGGLDASPMGLFSRGDGDGDFETGGVETDVVKEGAEARGGGRVAPPRKPWSLNQSRAHLAANCLAGFLVVKTGAAPATIPYPSAGKEVMGFDGRLEASEMATEQVQRVAVPPSWKSILPPGRLCLYSVYLVSCVFQDSWTVRSIDLVHTHKCPNIVLVS